MFKKIWLFLNGPIPKQQKNAFNREIVESTYRPTMIVATIILLILSLIMTSSMMYPDSFGSLQRLAIYRAMYTILFIFTFVCVFYGIAAKPLINKYPFAFLGPVYLYSFAICMWANILTAFELFFSDNIIALIYVSVFVSVIVVMKPWKSILLFIINFSSLYILVYYFSYSFTQTLGTIINSFVITILSIVVSIILYLFRVNNFLAKQTITEQARRIHEINTQLTEQVAIDDLTKIYNRRYYEYELPNIHACAVHNNKNFTVMMLDIDFFKQYNDCYGHLAGDAFLKKIVSIVKYSLQSTNHTFIRYGGEEFLIAATGLNAGEATHLAERIRRNIEKSKLPHAGGIDGYASVSIGVRVSKPYEQVDLTQLVSDADMAMYEAKNSGRNQVSLYTFHFFTKRLA